MEIAGYIKTSLIEWPGKIASVIFVPGCNFRCPFCHNADLVDIQKSAKRKEMKEETLFLDLVRRKKWIDAVVITGGEPTLQGDLQKFLKRIKKMGFLVMVQTNGTKPEIINELISQKLVDYLAMDIKGDFENYGKFINVKIDVSVIKQSIKIISGSGIEHEFRTTVVPGLHNLVNLTRLAKQMKKETKNSPWYLQQFRPVNTLDPKYMKTESFSTRQMEDFQKALQKVLPHIYLRGVL